jgi:hypothetical protein
MTHVITASGSQGAGHVVLDSILHILVVDETAEG